MPKIFGTFSKVKILFNKQLERMSIEKYPGIPMDFQTIHGKMTEKLRNLIMLKKMQFLSNAIISLGLSSSVAFSMDSKENLAETLTRKLGMV